MEVKRGEREKSLCSSSNRKDSSSPPLTRRKKSKVCKSRVHKNLKRRKPGRRSMAAQVLRTMACHGSSLATLLSLPRNRASNKLNFRCFHTHHPWLHLRLPRKTYLVSSPLSSSQSSFKHSHDDLSSSPYDAALLSAKECPDGSILFKFGSRDESSSGNSTDGISKEAENTSSNMAVDDNQGESMNLLPLNEEDQEEGRTERSTDKQATIDDLKQECSAADEEKQPADTTLKFLSGVEMRPHPSKVATGGEDAYFIEGLQWIGVADGVGGWKLLNINSGDYARELMSNCALLVQQERGVPNPKRVLIESVKKTKAVGSSTALIAALYRQTLFVVNIGDTGFTLIRNGVVVAKSVPMQRGFNFPYQIGTECDDPQIAESYEIAVCTGDVLVVGTDGLYDNVYETQLVDIIQSALQQKSGPQEAATALVRLAHEVGATTEGCSPFADAAIAAGYSLAGGKQDDVTVIVSYIQ